SHRSSMKSHADSTTKDASVRVASGSLAPRPLVRVTQRVDDQQRQFDRRQERRADEDLFPDKERFHLCTSSVLEEGASAVPHILRALTGVKSATFGDWKRPPYARA